uniref:DNTTIP1_dimer domain-containing protein n=1 Tax=Ascaris lumbricoides TaxID=6252 RepID=A0A0M3IMW1_ASCLU
MFERGGTGNGNGNKMNLRIEILEGLLRSMGEGSNAKINSLKQTIRRNKTDMAENTSKSLDLMRQVFQAEMTEEFRQVLDRHVRTTFSPAFENLRRNGHEVSDEDIKELCRNILESAKTPFLPAETTDPLKEIDPPSCRGFDSDVESEASVMSIVAQQPNVHAPAVRGRKRGRPRKWNADRVNASTRFILGSKVSRLLATAQRGSLYAKYPRMFRYVGDEDDRVWLIENRLTTRLSGKIFIMMLEDVVEIAALENYTYAKFSSSFWLISCIFFVLFCFRSTNIASSSDRPSSPPTRRPLSSKPL